MNRAILTVSELDHTYLTEQGKIETLHDITMAVAEGEFVSIVGPSGCGKTTLIKIVAGLLKPEKGAVWIDGESVDKARRNHKVSVVFQEPALMPWRSVLSNVMLPLEIIRDNERDRKRVAMGLLEIVGLRSYHSNLPCQLSGGMKHRVALARALTLEPALLIMDEPFAGLDQITRWKLNQVLLQIWKSNRTSILFVTHDVSEAVYLSDRVIVFTPGPGQVKTTVNVPLDRSTSPRNRSDPQFSETVALLLKCLEND